MGNDCQNIAMCSMGKDSMALLYTMKKYGIKIDDIIYVKIKFNETLTAELPEHETWIENYAIPKIKQDFGIDVKTVESDYTYIDLFNKEITRGPRKGKKRGFPLLFGSWCHRDLKIAPAVKYIKSHYKNPIQFIGIASDEPLRIDWNIKQGNKMPLVDYGITEEMAFEICKQNNVLSPAYKNFNRLGCWFCHKQGNVALSKVINLYPELWEKILNIDDCSDIKYKQKFTAKEIMKKIKGKKI